MPLQLHALPVSPATLPRLPRWLSPGLLPWGEMVLLDGPSGVGKSLFAAVLAAQASRGELPSQEKPINIIWVSRFDSFIELNFIHMIGANMDMQRFRRIHDPIDSEAGKPTPLFLDVHIDLLENCLRQHPNSLVVIDGLEEMLFDLPKQESLFQTCFWKTLAQIAKETQSCFLILRNQGLHQPKKAGRLADLGTRLARIVLTLAWHPTDLNMRILTLAKNQYGPTGTQYHMAIGDEGTVWHLAQPDDHARPGYTASPNTWTKKKPGRASQADKIVKELTTILAEPQKAKEVQDYFVSEGYPLSSLRTALQTLRVKHIRKGNAWWYILSSSAECGVSDAESAHVECEIRNAGSTSHSALDSNSSSSEDEPEAAIPLASDHSPLTTDRYSRISSSSEVELAVRASA